MPNWKKVHAISTGWPEDGSPWFIASVFPPPERREVRALWRNGWQALGCLRTARWDFGWRPFDPVPTEEPIAWKPEEGRDIPDPLQYGVRVYRA